MMMFHTEQRLAFYDAKSTQYIFNKYL